MDKIRVLFVSSGSSGVFGTAPFIIAQGESLKNFNIDVEYFKIIGRGIRGYLKNISLLRSHLNQKNYHLIHAHYGLSCWVAILAINKLPKIVSLMGDDAYGEYISKEKIKPGSYYLIILSKLLQLFVTHIIVKSDNIRRTVILKKKCSVIPNGINLNKFKLLDKHDARLKLDIPTEDTIILFLGNPNDSRKNLDLVRSAVKIVNNKYLRILTPYPVNHEEINLYLNAADLLILTSFIEGSPNVIKEAMACNCPIVSTDVGDVRWVIGKTDGCYITSFDPVDVAGKIRNGLEFSEKCGRTKGRSRIVELGLDSDTVAKRIVELYQKVLKGKY